MSIKINYNFILKASIAAFGTYFCMYAFRKPFTIAKFDGLSFMGIDYKILLIIAQVLGYTVSKFIGIRFISELKPARRLPYLIGFILFAEAALLGFAVVKPPYNIAFLFLNGLPLGMIWGIVFSYLEGRKSTELLGVILCSNFIISSGIVKSIGKYVLDTLHFSEFWMPFVTGLFFIIPLLFFSLLLNKLPEPSEEDIALKSERKPLSKKQRLQLFKQFSIPITSIVVFYCFLTAIRDFRDNFSREIWDELGYKDSIFIYTVAEIPIAIIVLIILGWLGSIKKNPKAFDYYHYALILGSIVTGISTVFFQNHYISSFLWMTLSGFGMYICYIPFNGLYFDRMIATYKINGNVGFLIYIADAFGYLGSIFVLLMKNFGQKNGSWLHYFIGGIYLVSLIGICTTCLSFLFFKRKSNKLIVYNSLSYE